MTRPKYTGPVTGKVYDLANGDKIDPVAEGIGLTGDKSSPRGLVNGREVFKRIFIRLRTPQETLTYRPIKDAEDFARRVSAIEHWFNSCVRNRNIVLTFEASELTDEQARTLAKEGGEL